MGGTIVLTLIEALLILLALLISKATRFISPSLSGDQLAAADDSTKDNVILTQKASPPSSYIVASPPATKYDVFLSFRGEDTRHTFASYLYKGLSNAGIHTFMDDELRKGEHISQILLRTIEESEISMIIFSENYASSTWCLDELVHILECKEKFGRVVIPIFYNVNPSNIRKQNGKFGNGFYELKQRFKDNPKKMQRWRNALIQSASFSGWDSNCIRPEFKFVEEIVKDTLSKLNNKPSPHLEGLVGIARHIENIGKLLSEAPIVGIWGMSGAGKTTLAKAIFQVSRDQFDAFSFIENVKEKLARITLDEFQQNCLKELLKDEGISIYDIKSTNVKNRLGRKKILLMLDDVDNSKIAADLTEVLNWCGEGSRVIITSRDMQVLQNASAFSMYHIRNLNFHDAIHLFSLKAFKQHEPSEDYMELSKSVVKYCQGNPLALIVLGCFLYGREKEDWGSALEKLNQDPPKDIVDVLKFSFDRLDGKQQNVFLDLAFLINEGVDISLNLIRQLYDSSAPIEISVLREKSLISSDDHGCVVMHDLMKKMGLQIARQQLLLTNPGTLVRLWKYEDIDYFFSCGKEMEAIRCMSLDMSKIQKITLRTRSFRRMHNLIFLKIYKSDWREPSMLNICGVLDYLPKELRFLSWEECPQPYVPLHFCAENLITLDMSESSIQQLWNGNQHFPNLKEIDLSRSKHLTVLPDLSLAPKIQRLDLEGCVSLSQIHSSTFLGKDFALRIGDCGPMQIKVGGSMKGRSSGVMHVSCYLDLRDLSFNKVTEKLLVCGNMICGVRFKHEVMPLEEIEELRKLGSLLPFARKVKWSESLIEFGYDLNKHYDYCYGDFTSDVDEEERGERGEMMNEHQEMTMSLMEGDEEDDEWMEDDDFNQYYHYYFNHCDLVNDQYSSSDHDFSDIGKKRMMKDVMEEKGEREEMMNEHQEVTMSLMEDDNEDDLLMEDDEVDDFNQHYHYYSNHCDLVNDQYSSGDHDFSDIGKKRMMKDDMEERGERQEMMNEHQELTMSLMEDDEEDDLLMEDCCSRGVIVTFTRVPNSITRWSLLKELTLNSPPLSNECCRRIKPHLDVTISFLCPLSWTHLNIKYSTIPKHLGFRHSFLFTCLLEIWSPDSFCHALMVSYEDSWRGINGFEKLPGPLTLLREPVII